MLHDVDIRLIDSNNQIKDTEKMRELVIDAVGVSFMHYFVVFALERDSKA